MTQNIIKKFNIRGPCNPKIHYMVPALERDSVLLSLINNDEYFIFHAPRQSGKTTLLMALTNKINEDSHDYALHCPLSALSYAENKDEAFDIICNEFLHSCKISKVPALNHLVTQIQDIPRQHPSSRVRDFLELACQTLDKQLILFFDEADGIPENALLPFLLQIRDGYNNRVINPMLFPKSIVLAGLRNLADYRSQDRPDDRSRVKHSPFNIQSLPQSVSNFSKEQIRALYKQHTDASGQVFDNSSIEKVWTWTEGQPWLVNALVDDIINRQLKKNYSLPIDGTLVDIAVNELFQQNNVHIDSLIQRLDETRVKRVMMSALSFSDVHIDSLLQDDIRYCVNLGLLKFGNNGYSDCLPANLFYSEMIIKNLTYQLDIASINVTEQIWMDGISLDMNSILKTFQEFWLQNSLIMAQHDRVTGLADNIINALSMAESVKQNGIIINPSNISKINKEVSRIINESFCVLVLFAFLQRVLNGGAELVRREYAVNQKFIDINVIYKGRSYPIEAKIKDSVTTESGIKQLLSYINNCNATQGWLIEFDRNPEKPLKDKISFETHIRGKNTVFVVGC
jgi:hypothetical protein